MIETDRDRLTPLVSRRGFMEQSFKVAGVSSLPVVGEHRRGSCFADVVQNNSSTIPASAGSIDV